MKFHQRFEDGRYLVWVASGDVAHHKTVTIRLNGRNVVRGRLTAADGFVELKGYQLEITGGELSVELGPETPLNYVRIVSAKAAVAQDLKGTTDLRKALGQKKYDPFGECVRSNENSTLNMHLLPEGEFSVDRDEWGPIVRVNMLRIKAWAKVPGVKKAWLMQGYEGEPGMAFHPIMSEVKDVDGDGKPDIFRCRSEYPGAQIERLRYDDGSVVWVSIPWADLSATKPACRCSISTATAAAT